MKANPIETILDYFAELDWDHRFYPEDGSVDASYAGDSGTWQCRAVWDSQAEIFCFYSFLPTTVPLERRYAMMELITRLNLGQRYGDFELDMGSGSLALRTYLLCRELELKPADALRCRHGQSGADGRSPASADENDLLADDAAGGLGRGHQRRGSALRQTAGRRGRLNTTHHSVIQKPARKGAGFCCFAQ